MPLRIPLLTCLLGAALSAQAAEFQTVASIREAALSALAPGAEAEATLDPALRLPACAGALVARVNGASSIEVSCPLAAGWRVFVPVRVRRSQTVLVLNRNIGAGQPIDAQAFSAQTRDATRLVGGALADPGGAIGRIARRPLLAGSVLSSEDLVSARRIRRGDNVELVTRSGGIEVRVAGRALGDAGENERLNVENLSSRKVVQGMVDGAGDVLVSR